MQTQHWPWACNLVSLPPVPVCRFLLALKTILMSLIQDSDDSQLLSLLDSFWYNFYPDYYFLSHLKVQLLLGKL